MKPDLQIIRKIIEFKDYEIRANNVNIVREKENSEFSICSTK
jgi:hypothetical protein